MSLLRRKGLFESTKVLFLPIAAISPNPDQPRTCFSREGLEELAASIQELGVLQPLSVRRSKNGGYELISGERRLRASRMAGLTEVPCILAVSYTHLGPAPGGPCGPRRGPCAPGRS